MMTPCGNCILGVENGAICKNCNGTTFIDSLLVNEPNMNEQENTPIEVGTTEAESVTNQAEVASTTSTGEVVSEVVATPVAEDTGVQAPATDVKVDDSIAG